jgi:hypothetical protein
MKGAVGAVTEAVVVAYGPPAPRPPGNHPWREEASSGAPPQAPGRDRFDPFGSDCLGDFEGLQRKQSVHRDHHRRR